MSAARRTRAVRATRAAQQVEDGLKLAAFQARQRVREAEAAMAAEQERARGRAGGHPRPRPAGPAVQAGLRHQRVLDAARRQLEVEAAEAEQPWHAGPDAGPVAGEAGGAARHRAAPRRRLAENAEWQDVVTSRAGRTPVALTAAGTTPTAPPRAVRR